MRGYSLLMNCVLAAALAAASEASAQQVSPVLPRPCSASVVSAAEALQDSCAASTKSVEQKKVNLARALFPDSPFLESLVEGVWPYDWEGMLCERVNLTPAPGDELLTLLYISGSERSVSLTVIEHDSSVGWQRYDLMGSEIGIQNTLFLLGDEELLDRLAKLAPGESGAPLPWARDFDGDGVCELIVHSTTPGYLNEDRSGPLYWPEVYAWRDGAFVNVSTEFPKLYEATVLPLYSGLVDDLQADWKDAGKLGTQPTVEKINQIMRLLDKQGDQQTEN